MQKHVYGRVVERKRPLQEYDQYSSRAKHTALDESKVTEYLRSISHETGLLQVLCILHLIILDSMRAR